MYVHQYAKGEPNQSTDGTVIGPDVHTHSPLFLPQIYQFTTSFYTFYICIFIQIYIPWGWMKTPLSLQT